MPPHYRDVLIWHFFEECTFTVIGNRLDRSEDAARKLCDRALTLFAQHLHRLK